jgi:nitrogen regulatory protein P-II 1
MFLRQEYDINFLIKAEIVIPQNDVQAIDEALKQIQVGGITVYKVKGRGKSIGPSIHASKGTEIFTPEFNDKYILQVVVPDEKENDVIKIVRTTSKMGKIFISPIKRAIDIGSGQENEQAI